MRWILLAFDRIGGVAQQFTILNPCSKRWPELAGEGRTRFCPACETFIHALEQYSDKEIEDLRRESGGRLCGYLAAEFLPPPRSRRAVLLGALLTAASPVMAQSGRVRIRVTDAMGAVVPGAVASLFGTDRKVALTGRADEAGEIVLTGVPMKVSEVRVTHPGFKIFSLVGVPNLNADELKLDVKLEAGGEVMGVVSFKKRKHWWLF